MLNKKHRKKGAGFTLVELLAVIIVLAVVATITIPLVSNLMEKSRKTTFVNSVYNAINAVKEDMSNNNFQSLPDEGISAKDGLKTLEKNPFISGKFRKRGSNIEALNVTDGRYCASGSKDKLDVILGECYLLDKTGPVAELMPGVITSNSIQVVMDAYDEESNIVNYQFSIDNGATWTSKQTSNSYTYTKLRNGSSFNFKALVTNQNNLTTEKSATFRTLNIDMPTYTSNPSLGSWSKQKIVTINYPVRQSNFIYEYSTDNARTWSVVPSGNRHNITFNDNGNLTARVRDGYNTVTASTLTITTIDTLTPFVSLVSTDVTNTTISVKATGKGSNMGIKGYQYSVNNGASWSTLTTSNIYTYSGLSRNTTYPLKVRIFAGNDKTADSATLNVKTLNTFKVTFDANGGNVTTTSKLVTGGGTYGALPNPTRENYNFLGWYTASSGGTKVTSETTVSLTSDQTLYAQWKLNTVIVTFDANGGVGGTTRSVSVGSSIGTLPGASKANYSHQGWYTVKGGGTKLNSNYIINNAQTFYARWNFNGHGTGFTNNKGYRMNIWIQQTGLNSITVTADMSNNTFSACGIGYVSVSCAGQSQSQRLDYKFGVGGICSNTYQGAWTVGMPSFTFGNIKTGSAVACSYTFDSRNVLNFGNNITVGTSGFTMGN